MYLILMRKILSLYYLIYCGSSCTDYRRYCSRNWLFREFPGSLIFTTVVSSIILNMIAVDNYVTAVITGNMFRKAYIQRGLHPLNLSKCLAERTAITSPLIPWNTCGIVMFGMIGVSTTEFGYLNKEKDVRSQT